ncbi:MAG: hypothetical protein M1829_006020 [Trizodia sp. TS-e1964]|nr:MAG: hypothetical protein M1829_006020 [Trizodia sp. TS-e1964]
MSHSHPLSEDNLDHRNGAEISFQSSQQQSDRGSLITDHPKPSPPNHSEILNHQSRRLQLRNAGFRGPILPFSRRAASIPYSGIHKRRGIHTRQAKATNREPYSPLGILGEINNSLVSSSSYSGPIFEDSSHGGVDFERYLSETDDDMKLREGSLNPRLLSPAAARSPIGKQAKIRQKRGSNMKAGGTESIKYIEHLESQLADMLVKLQTVTSPSQTRVQATKLKALNTESRALKQVVHEWEIKFNERVQEELKAREEAENLLRSRLRSLEKELETKENKNKELAWEHDKLRRRAKGMEDVEAENLNLERRLDVLTGLLAQSPTRADSTMDNTPLPGRKGRRPSRPATLMLPIGSSSDYRLPPPTPSSRTNLEGRDFGISGSPSSSSQLEGDFEDLIDSPTRIRHSADLDLVLEGAAGKAKSRSSSITSNMSAGVFATLDSPFPDINSAAGLPTRKRRMRRFHSGACAPKTLILPAASYAGGAFPASAPLPETPQSQMDDGTPRGRPSSSHGVPLPADEMSTPSWHQHTETLRLLEAHSTNQRFSCPNPDSSGQSFGGPLNSELGSEFSRPPLRRGYSLFRELSLAQSPIEESVIVEQALETSALEVASGPAPEPTPTPQLRHRTPFASPPTLISSRLCLGPPGITPAGKPVRVTIFSNFTILLSDIWQNPRQLAKRVVSNSLRMVSESRYPKAAFGLGWWFLGFVMKTPTRTNDETELTSWTSYSLGAGKARRFSGDVNAGSVGKTVYEAVRAGQNGGGNTGAIMSFHPAIFGASHPTNEKPSIPDRIFLWLKFSAAIVLAVGIALRHGPAKLLIEHVSEDSLKNRPATETSHEEIGLVDLATPQKLSRADTGALQWGYDLGIGDFQRGSAALDSGVSGIVSVYEYR